MGRHTTDERRRGIAAWPVIIAAVVVLIAAATTVYLVVTRQRSTVADCTSKAVLAVTSAPGADRAVTAAAQAFDATKPIARSACITTTVTTMSGGAAATALAGGWKGISTPAPALWVADSAADLAAVDAADSALIAGHSTIPLATSPVVLAVRTPNGTAAAAVSWQKLPEQAGGAKPLALPEGGRLTLALPPAADNPATTAALLSVVAAQRPTSASGPADAAAVTSAATSLRALAAAAPAEGPTATETALSELSAGKAAGYTAVPAFEAEVAVSNGSAATPPLTAVYPAGATVSAQMLTAPVTAGWVSEAQSDAAAAFEGFLSSPAGKKILADNGFRVPGTAPSTAFTGVRPSTAITPLAGADAKAQEALGSVISADPVASTSATTPSASAPPGSTGATSTAGATTTGSSRASSSAPSTASSTGAPPATSTGLRTTVITAAGPVVTFVVDASAAMATVEGGKNRNQWVQQALTAATAAHPAGGFGLWTVSTDDGAAGYSQRVTTGQLTDKLGGTTRGAALDAAIGALTPTGSAWIYGAVQTAYSAAADGAATGRPNKVIVITASTDATPALSRSTVISSIAAKAGSNVQLQVIGVSPAVNVDAMTQIAQAGHGSYLGATGPTLSAAVAAALKA